MATPVQNATAQLNPTFNTATAGINTLVPQVQDLYNTLVQGLQTGVGTQTQNIAGAANRAGVNTGTLVPQAADTLALAINPGLAQLGAQNAANVGELQGQVGKTNVARAQSVQDLASALQRQDIASGQNKLKLSELQQNAKLQMQQNQQAFNVNQAQYQTAQAKAAARAAQQASQFDLTTVGKDTLTRQLRVGLDKVKGGDNHVSPENLAKAYNTWIAAGLDAPSFWKNFQGDWNPNQKTYNDQFHYFVNKGV